MELKVCYKAAGGLHARTVPRIHYMELKGSRPFLSSQSHSGGNPLHGVESCSRCWSLVAQLRESITWSWKYVYTSAGTVSARGSESITWSWKPSLLYMFRVKMGSESITWSWKTIVYKVRCRVWWSTTRRIHYMELKGSCPWRRRSPLWESITWSWKRDLTIALTPLSPHARIHYMELKVSV